MLISEVRKLETTDRWIYWIEERELVRKRKALGKPKPWTDDEILRTYRFCNVRRMDDKVSQYLLNNWYVPFRDHPLIVPAVALARFLNKIETLEEIKPLVFQSRWNSKALDRKLRQLKSAGKRIFSAAYMVRGQESEDKICSVLEHYVKPLLLIKDDLHPSSMEDTWEKISSSYGVGSFMAGQIVADLRWAKSGKWKDKKHWAPKGPGSARGMNRLMGRPLKTSISQTQFVLELTDAISVGTAEITSDELVKKLEGIDWQNTLCEFDKYERVLWGEGRPKQKYPGTAL